MPRLPRVTGTQAVRALGRDGWRVERTTGSHQHLKHATKPGLVTVPIHSGRILKPKVMQAILAQAGLTADAFRALL
jgi:predicted RNA binding protein YcfA (HicA-like mRNA interferase family)